MVKKIGINNLTVLYPNPCYNVPMCYKGTISCRFEACWPAMAKDTTGIIFVYNPDVTNHDKELENW